MHNKIILAMSGGVDSSAAALILKNEGFDVIGVTLKLYDHDISGENKGRTCCSLEDVFDARSAAARAGIEHFVLNFKDIFAQEVIERFIYMYHQGKTPNPCIDCNKYIKFAALFAKAKLIDIEKIATGHYARIKLNPVSGRYNLLKAVDKNKDQSYMLNFLTQEDLARLHFPLGDYNKSEVREIAEKYGLLNSQKPDSQDICFVPGGNYRQFLVKKTGKEPEKGDFVNMKGDIVGRHLGIDFYTVGQRKGLGLNSDRPLYVVKIDASANIIIVGDEKDLYKEEIIAGEVNLISINKINGPLKAEVKTRYSQHEVPATIYPQENKKVKICFDRPVRAATPGQAAVFYQEDVVVGGGIILDEKEANESVKYA